METVGSSASNKAQRPFHHCTTESLACVSVTSPGQEMVSGLSFPKHTKMTSCCPCDVQWSSDGRVAIMQNAVGLGHTPSRTGLGHCPCRWLRGTRRQLPPSWRSRFAAAQSEAGRWMSPASRCPHTVSWPCRHTLEILQYLSLHFASTLAVLPTLIVRQCITQEPLFLCTPKSNAWTCMEGRSVETRLLGKRCWHENHHTVRFCGT